MNERFWPVAALGGLEVYKALGYGDNVTYYSDIPTTEGGHCSARPEWVTPLKNNIERFLKKTGTAPGVIRASSMQTGDLSTWRSWTTPTLNLSAVASSQCRKSASGAFARDAAR